MRVSQVEQPESARIWAGLSSVTEIQENILGWQHSELTDLPQARGFNFLPRDLSLGMTMMYQRWASKSPCRAFPSADI